MPSRAAACWWGLTACFVMQATILMALLQPAPEVKLPLAMHAHMEQCCSAQHPIDNLSYSGEHDVKTAVNYLIEFEQSGFLSQGLNAMLENVMTCA